jgi:rod shape-determining protein MreB
MVVDIGGGTTDIAVLTMNSIATSASIKVAGNAFDEAIIKHVRRTHGVVIGQTTAEDIKIQIGCVYPPQQNNSMVVKGRAAKNGVPKELTLYATEIYDVLRRPARLIVEELLSVLEDTSPELVGDIAKNGITLTGGGSQLAGMDLLLSECTGVACTVADDPDSCVAFGCGKSLSWINTMSEGPINIAKKRLLREE